MLELVSTDPQHRVLDGREFVHRPVQEGDEGRVQFGRLIDAAVQERIVVRAVAPGKILVFADVLDDFVIVRYLSSDASTETTSMRIYQTARAAPTPALNAMATIILVVSALVIVLGWLAYRRWTRKQGESTDVSSLASTL